MMWTHPHYISTLIKIYFYLLNHMVRKTQKATRPLKVPLTQIQTLYKPHLGLVWDQADMTIKLVHDNSHICYYGNKTQKELQHTL